MSQELVVPGVGELVDLEDARSCAQALAGIRQLEQQLRDVKAALTDAIVVEMERQGTQTLDVGNGVKAVLGGGSETHWDVDTLEQLRDLGLPEDRYNALVKVEYSCKVNAAEAKRIAAANPAYKAVVEAAQSKYPRQKYVSLRRKTG